MRTPFTIVFALTCTAWYASAQGPVEPTLATRSVDGAVLYTAHCEVCHGRNGTGDGVMASALEDQSAGFISAGPAQQRRFPL